MKRGLAPTVVILGPQRFGPTLGEAVRALGVQGRIATVTAGWQERESEDQELRDHLGGDAHNLVLHQRAEEVFRDDPELGAAYRSRQVRLRHLQDFYRIRLDHAREAALVIGARAADPEMLADERRASIEDIRALDARHLEVCRRIQAEFEDRWKSFERPAVARHRKELKRILRGSAALAIAGGHVAVLLNRLRMFGVAELLDGHPVFAWSAGAMAVAERVVLFHDDPPYGTGFEEVLDVGLGLCPGVVPLPHPNARLRLSDPDRVAMFAQRFAPAMCLAMPGGSRITKDGEGWSDAHGVTRLDPTGELTQLERPAEGAA